MIPVPPEGIYLPTADQFQYLVQATHRMEARLVTMVQQLSDLRDGVAAIAASEAAQTDMIEGTAAVVSGLATSVQELITLVTTLREDLSPEQQALVDETTASVSATLAEVSQQSAALAAQRDQLAALAASAEAATETGTPPTP